MGWGEITATLIMVVKAGLNRSSQGRAELVSPKEEVEVLVDASTSTIDLRFAVQAREICCAGEEEGDRNLEYQR